MILSELRLCIFPKLKRKHFSVLISFPKKAEILMVLPTLSLPLNVCSFYGPGKRYRISIGVASIKLFPVLFALKSIYICFCLFHAITYLMKVLK